MAEKARPLYQRAAAAALAVLILGPRLDRPAGSVTVNKDDGPLTDATSLSKIDANQQRTTVAKVAKERMRKKAEATERKTSRAEKNSSKIM